MSATKAALKSELNIKTRTSNKLKNEENDDYEPTNLLAELVTNTVNEYFDEREEVYQDLPERANKKDLELTSDVYSNVPYIAPRLNEDSGLYMNMQYSAQGVTSDNTHSTNMPFINFGGNTFANNYNAFGLKNTDLPTDGLTENMMKQGFYTSYQYQAPRYWGNISNEGLLQSVGGPWTKKYVGQTF